VVSLKCETYSVKPFVTYEDMLKNKSTAVPERENKIVLGTVSSVWREGVMVPLTGLTSDVTDNTRQLDQHQCCYTQHWQDILHLYMEL
jgi:hypothetical protein